ncbi:helix-turn-helix domain-containing protein [Microbacterium sp. 4R-513]|uniref:helix-turn-helix domain-containing protein n=1 Tax=Microbacterium sp. 4R-513 TaxID=2567934 RepID=UPI0013E14D5D|nr:helix-turn-helix domain-containing protein [Microbacterium sp. 4R-513]QIG39580.1 helix-turn-helix domain-containing protein [Microbacterium sp. 4R-513]
MMDDLETPYTRRFARSTNVDEARGSMRELYGTSMALVADPPQEFRYEAAAVTDEGFSAATLRFIGACRSGTDSFPDLIVAHAPAGRHRWRAGRESGPGAIPFLVPPGRDLRVEFSGLHLRTLRIEGDALRRTAQALTGREPGPLRLEGLNGSSQHHALMIETLRFVEATLIADPTLRDAPLVRSQIAHQALTSVFATFPLIDLTATRPAATSRALRRAISHMEQHLQDPLSIADIAITAGVSTRALQSAFQRQFSMTPSHYLRRLRLRAAHEDLRNATDARVAVRDVARKWGFVHAGRFAQLYADQYGERPSDTLRR